MSAFFTMAVEITPFPDSARRLLVFLAWLGLVLSCIGWLFAHFPAWRPKRGGYMELIGVAIIGALLAIGIWKLTEPSSLLKQADGYAEMQSESGVYKIERGGVQWTFRNFFAPTGGGGEIRFPNFQAFGKNGKQPIAKISGFIRSDLTGEQLYNLGLVIGGRMVPPSKTYGIPPNAEFTVTIPLSEKALDYNTYLTEYQLLERFGAFTFVVFLDGARYEFPFSTTQVRKSIDAFRAYVLPPEKPRVTEKPN